MKTIKSNKNLFTFLNYELIDQIEKLASRNYEVRMQFIKQYNLEYVGEIAERWESRGFIEETNGPLSLIMGLASTNKNDFLYDQAELFVTGMGNYILNHWDVKLAISLLYFAVKHSINLTKNDTLSILKTRVLASNLSELDYGERLYIIYLGSTIYCCTEDGDIKLLVLDQISLIDLLLSNPFTDYPVLNLMYTTYKKLGQPKAKEFKKKGITSWFSTLKTIHTREISLEHLNKHAKVLSVTDRDVLTFNYILGVFVADELNKPSSRAQERIFKNFISEFFLSQDPLPNNIFNFVVPDKQLTGLLSDLSDIPNTETMEKILKSMSDSVVERYANRSYIPLLSDERIQWLSSNTVTSVIKDHLFYRVDLLNKEQFLNLESRRLEYGLEIKATASYVRTCIEYGLLGYTDIEYLDSMDMLKEAINYFENNHTFEEYISYLEKVPKKYHSRLRNNISNYHNEVYGNYELAKRLYSMYLQSVIECEPENYATCLYELLQNKNFISLFPYSAEEIRELEDLFCKENFISKTKQEEIRIKHATSEELIAMEVSKVEQKISGGYWGSIEEVILKYIKLIKQHEILKEAAEKKLLSESISTSYDLKRYLYVVYILKQQRVFSNTQLKTIEQRAYHAISKQIQGEN
ncbi:hypothetical protein [Bacillus bombysepticus]|uniref:hypothetical protein n=1 Tax=Bacillus bombysepticus TaxID=658666 RepID=UPI00301A5E67